MKNVFKRLLASLMTFIIAFSFIPCINTHEVYADSYGVSNPRVTTDETVWDCVYFGSYPQTEVVAERSQCGTYGKDWEQNSDCIVDATLYNQLQNSVSWGADDVGWAGGSKYKRIKKGDANYAPDLFDESWNYYWSDSTTYHFFKFEPIKWRVLNVNGSNAFLLADRGLDGQKYNQLNTSVTWETCTLRSWLNGNFINTFSGNERGAIYTTNIENIDNLYYGTEGGNNTNDKIFLLSESEVYSTDKSVSYGFVKSGDTYAEQRTIKTSTYAKAMGMNSSTGSRSLGNCIWWLRSPGSNFCNAVEVDSDGLILGDGGYVVGNNHAVRPALHLNLESDVWSLAGTVSSAGNDDTDGGGTNPTPDPPPTPPTQNNELNFSKDTWGFSNYSDSGFLGLTSKHKVSDYYKNLLLSKSSPSEKSAMENTIKNEKGDGHCYGMASTVISKKMGMLNIPGVQNLKSASKTQDIENLICYYHLTQNLRGAVASVQNFMSKSVAQRLSEIESKANAVKSGNSPVLISFGAEGWAAHAIVGYAVEPGSFTSSASGITYNHRILTYDSNSVDWDPNACILYNSGTSKWEIPKYYNNGVRSTNSKAYLKRALNEPTIISAKYSSTVTPEKYKGEIIVYGQSLYLVDNNNKTVTVNGATGETTGDSSFYAYSEDSDNEVSANPAHIILSDDDESCTVSTKSGNSESINVSLLLDDTFVSMDSDEAKNASFNPNGEVSIEDNDGEFNLTVARDTVNNNEYPTYVVSGDSTGDVSLVVNKNGAVIEGDNLQGLVVTATDKNDNEHQYVIADDVEEIKLHAENNQIVIGEGQNEGSGTGGGGSSGGGGSAGGGEAESPEEIEENEQREEPEKELAPVVSTSFKSLKSGKNFIRLRWKKKAVSGYEIQYSTVSNFKKSKTKIKKINKGTTTTATIKKLKPNRKYYIRIRTYYEENNNKDYSAWSSRKYIKTKRK